jgi:hypothetical protein
VEACKTRLVATACWREEHVAVGARCPECHTNRNSHCMVGLGPGLDGSPIVYASPPRAESTDPVAAVAHVACELEKGFAAPGAGPQWVWLVDMRGYTLWSSIANTSSGIEMARAFSAHYPERLGRVVLLEPPTVFSVLFSVSLDLCLPCGVSFAGYCAVCWSANGLRASAALSFGAGNHPVPGLQDGGETAQGAWCGGGGGAAR